MDKKVKVELETIPKLEVNGDEAEVRSPKQNEERSKMRGLGSPALVQRYIPAHKKK